MVSAIITTHNRLELLKRAVQSVYNQANVNIELIVVDDGSSDGTQQWCIKQKFKYIRIEPQDSHGGNYARNLGIKNAIGEYIAFLDDDDYWLPDKTIKQIELIKDKKCEVVFGGRILEIINNGKPYFREDLPNKSLQGDMKTKILLRTCTTTTTMLTTKNILEKVGYFDENLKFWQEYELSMRLAQVSEFYFINQPVAVYRIDENDVSRLTNKFYGWLDAVNYIHNKHANLYTTLSLRNRLKSKGFIYREAYWRSKTARLTYAPLKYLVLSLLYSPSHTISKAFSLLKKK